MSANDGAVFDVYHGHLSGCQWRWPSRANHNTIKLYSSMASGAVRSTERRVQPGGSSNPKCCLQSWFVTSRLQRMAYQVRTCSAVA